MYNKIFAYCRVSTNDKCEKQNYERQKYLLEHSNYKIDEIFEEHISGGIKGNQREQFNKMLSMTDNLTLILLTETSRFGRNYIDCFEMLDIITQQKGASVKFLSNGIELKGSGRLNPYQWLTISNFFIQDEFLKRQIGYNTSNALQRKKEQGIKLGRPKAKMSEKEEAIAIAYINGNVSMEEIAERFETNKSKVARSVTKYKKEQGEKQ